MGRAVGARLALAGHHVSLGSRTPRPRDEATGAMGTVTYADATRHSDLILLTTEGVDCAAALAAAGPLAGKILLDCTNPDRPDGYTLAQGRDTSLGEENAKHAPGAAVVKALNHMWADTIEDPEVARRAPVAFVCGDDDAAKRTVISLLEQLGLTPVDAGGLVSARYTEPLAVLTVSMVSRLGWEPQGVEISLAGAPRSKGRPAKG